MEQHLVIAILAGLGGMFGWGLADFFAKKTIDQVGDVVSLAWGHIFGTLALGLAAGYRYFAHDQSLVLPADESAWFFLIFFGVLQAIVYYLLYRGFGKGQISLLNPVFASFSGLTALFSIIFFHEQLGNGGFTALAIIFIGILLLNVDIQALRSRRISFVSIPGMKEVALATLLAAFWTLFWDRLVTGEDWLSYAFYMYTFMTVAILIMAMWQKIKLTGIPTHIWKFLILIGLCETVAYLAISWGYSITSFTSIVALLSGAFSLPTIILARMFLGEHVSRLQTVGSLVIIAGIIVLSLV